MIIDTISNAAQYHVMGEGLKKGLEFLKQEGLAELAPGRYDIDGDNCYALVLQYGSAPVEEGKYEAHRKYYDIQYVIDGTERMGYADIATLKVTKEYDSANDACLLAGEGDFLTARAGTFLIFAPQDAHMPGIAIKDPSPVKKVVVKVRI